MCFCFAATNAYPVGQRAGTRQTAAAEQAAYSYVTTKEALAESTGRPTQHDTGSAFHLSFNR